MSRVAVKEDEDEKKKEKKEDGNSINKAQNKINSQMKLNGKFGTFPPILFYFPLPFFFLWKQSLIFKL